MTDLKRRRLKQSVLAVAVAAVIAGCATVGGGARYSFETDLFTVAVGPASVVGKAVVIHRDPDDYKSQPAGDSGPRIACGVVQRT